MDEDISTRHESIQEWLRRRVDKETYRHIRRLWMEHSIAEDNRDIPGLIATLTPTCVYEVPLTRHRWEGRPGAERFYTELLTAFPDIHFDLQSIVIGPQGVWEEAWATGTWEQPWIDLPPTGRSLALTIQIYFPYNEGSKLFDGERMFFDLGQLTATA